jgi:hypothetical protein
MNCKSVVFRVSLAVSLVATFLFAATGSAFAGQSPAQTFTAGITGGLDRADLLLRKAGSPVEPLTVEIRNAASGQPGTEVLASASIPMSALGSSPGFVPATFATPAAVTAGTQYALVAYTTHPTNDCCGWRYQDGTDPYSGGAGFFSNTVPPQAPWSTQGGGDDYAFMTYVEGTLDQQQTMSNAEAGLFATPPVATPPVVPTPPAPPPRSGAANAVTQQITYRPFNAAGKIAVPVRRKKKGECFSQSLKASRPGAVRCLRRNQILDPCFKSPKARRLVVCVRAPTSVAVRLKVPRVPKTRRPYLHNAWAVTVAAGECPLIAGATTVSPYGRLNYACPGQLFLFGNPIPHDPDWVIWGGHDSQGGDAQQLPITTVWY